MNSAQEPVLKQEEIADSCKKIICDINQIMRKQHPGDEKINFSRAGLIKEQQAYFYGNPVKRYIIILHGNGCEWATSSHGGCTMCGHFHGASLEKSVTAEMLRNQFDDAYNQIVQEESYILCVYNGGSFFNENEVNSDLRRYILEKVSQAPRIVKLIVESRTEYITDAVLDELDHILENVEVEIGVGLESVNPFIRNVILNKGVEEEAFYDLSQRLQMHKAQLLLYILVKPPFLTEQEAIQDAVASIQFAHQLGAKTVSLEPVSVQKDTLVYMMYKNELFFPAWIWSIFEIIKQTNTLSIEKRIGGFNFYPPPEKYANNCDRCNPVMLQIIEKYNATNRETAFKNAVCSGNCQLIWEQKLETMYEAPLEKRIFNNLIKLLELCRKESKT